MGRSLKKAIASHSPSTQPGSLDYHGVSPPSRCRTRKYTVSYNVFTQFSHCFTFVGIAARRCGTRGGAGPGLPQCSSSPALGRCGSWAGYCASLDRSFLTCSLVHPSRRKGGNSNIYVKCLEKHLIYSNHPIKY